MEWDVIAPMVVALTLIVTAGTVYLLRPIMARLGNLLEVMSKERLGELPARSEDRQLRMLKKRKPNAAFLLRLASAPARDELSRQARGDCAWVR